MRLLIASLILAFVSPSLTHTADVLTVSVRNVATVVSDAEDSDFVFLAVRYDAILQNPKSADLRIAPGFEAVTQVDRLRRGEWGTMHSSDWLDVGKNKYSECKSLRPGQTITFPRVSSPLFLRKTDSDAHSALVLRFHFDSVCAEGENWVIQHLVTEPVEVKIPAW